MKKSVYYYLHIFQLLWDLIWYWHQTSTFPLLLAHLSVCALPGMSHSKIILSFFSTSEFDEWDNQIFRIVSLHLFWRWKTYNSQCCTFWSSSFLKQGNLWICQNKLAKRTHFFKNKRLFLPYKCCTCQSISFFLPSGWSWLI